MSLPDGFGFELREVGLRGPRHREGRAAVYRRPGGASFWTASAAGWEEWLLLTTPRSGPAVEWEVRGATLRQHGEAVEVLDALGRSRLSVNAPAAYGEDGGGVKVRLIAEDARLALAIDGATGMVLVDPAWEPTAPMATARDGHTATLLSSGKVLVVGGLGDSGLLATAELYDPAGGRFASTGPLATGRTDHTATLLSSGQVLVAGGWAASGFPAWAELYDPATGTFAPTGPLATPRYAHTATLLASGKVLVAGGTDSSDATVALDSAELYDPAAGTFASTGSLTTARRGHTATLLPSGMVLLAGGEAGGSAELYDPDAGSFAPTGPLGERGGNTATLLPSGKVLVAGGAGEPGLLRSTELYDPVAGTFSSTGPLAAGRIRHAATLLPSGLVLVVAGQVEAADFWWTSWDPSPTAELYDPDQGSFAETAALTKARYDHTATLLPSGKVLVAGGFNFGFLSSAELYDPAGIAPQSDGGIDAPGGTFPDGPAAWDWPTDVGCTCRSAGNAGTPRRTLFLLVLALPAFFRLARRGGGT